MQYELYVTVLLVIKRCWVLSSCDIVREEDEGARREMKNSIGNIC